MRKKQASILIVDDDDAVLFAARVWLKNFFEEIIITNSPKDILSILGKKNIDVILLDMNFRRGFEDGKEGLYWLKQIHEIDANIPILLMTAYGEIELAIEALKNGATDFILKPWNNDKLQASVNLAVELSRKNKKQTQSENLQPHLNQYHLETASPKMLSIMQTLKKVASTEANILLLGENGTGKYVMAEYIHQQSERRLAPFIHIDLGSLAENLFESELFGYTKGAFTDAKQTTLGKLEMANGGTVFLDEIGNLPLHLQQKLLTVIQTKTFSRLGDAKKAHLNVRFIFATNAALTKMIAENSFREDLYYRINTVEIEIPPLRERTEDLEAISLFFLNKFQNKYKKAPLRIKNFDTLKNYPFLGNIRELEHLIERAVILADGNEISIQLTQRNWEDENEPTSTLNLEEMEEKLIKKALKKHQGNISLTAEALGLSRAALYRRMDKFGI